MCLLYFDLLTSTKRSEKVFVWGDGSAIYALSRRLPPGKYVAYYHIKDFSTPEKTIKSLNQDMPSYIIILPDVEYFSELDSFLKTNYAPVKTIEKAEIWKLLNPKVRALIAR